MITSTINHKTRTKFGLSIEQYIMLDYLYSLQVKNIKPTKELVTSAIGFDVERQKELTIQLIRKEFYVSGQGVTDKWASQFDYTAEFEEFWVLFLKKGNRATAETKYIACRKFIERGILFDAAEKYIKSKAGKERQFIMSCETWLNPKAQRWLDVIDFEEVKKYTATNKKELA